MFTYNKVSMPEFEEVIHIASSPCYIPVLGSLMEGNFTDKYLNSLDRTKLEKWGYELLGEFSKSFFDIDGKGIDLMNMTYEFKAHLDSLLETGQRKFIYCFSRPEDMLAYHDIKPASDDKERRKLSFHIIFEDKAIKRLGFKPEHDEKTLEWLLGRFYEKLRPCVDTGVYDINRKIRLPYFSDYMKPVCLYPHDETINLTRFSINLPPAIYKVQVPKGSTQKDAENEEKKTASIQGNTDKPLSFEQKEELLELLSHVKKERFQEGNSFNGPWASLGRMLKGHGFPKEIFLKISKESGYKDYNEEDVLGWWYSSDSNTTKGYAPPGFPTIENWLKEDGVDYNSLRSLSKRGVIGKMKKKIFETGELSHGHAAEIFYEEMKDDLFKTPMGWIVWDEKTGWQVGMESIVILPFMKICGMALSSYVTTMKIDDLVQNPSDLDKNIKKQIDADEKKKLLRKVSNKMLDHGYITKTIKILGEMCKNDTIVKEFDNHPELFAFSDLQAYDLVQGKMVRILKEHKILTTCGRPAPERVEDEIQAAKEFVLTYQESRALDSFLSMCACSLYGKNKNQVIFIHTGMGGNGKSVHADLMTKTLGGYAGLLPIEQFTIEQKSRNEANSSLAALVGKRYARSNEPEDDAGQKLKISRIKQITGDEEVDVRKLYGDPFQMSIKFTPHVLANDIPSLSKQDGGIARRIKVVRYPYLFKDSPDEDDPYQRLKILDLNIDQYKNGFFFLCADMWKRTNGVFIDSADVQDDVEEYLRENNPLIPFLVNFQSSDKFIRSKELHKLFDEYCDVNKIERYKSKAFSAILENSILSDGSKVKIEKDPKNGNKVFVKQIIQK